MNLAKLAEVKTLKEGEKLSLIYEGREITNMEMMSAAKRLASALKDLGVERGDRVILQMPNCPEVLQGFGAIWQLGAVVVPINWLVGDEEIAYIYEDSGAKVVISSAAFLTKIESARQKTRGVKDFILIEKDIPAGYLSYSDLIQKSPESKEFADTADDELAALIYTAGTTGRPKGVMHSHGTLYSNAEMQFNSIKLPDNFISLGVLPLCHSYGIASMNNGLFRKIGATVLLNGFDLKKIFTAIEKYKIDVISGVPTMFVYMLLYPELDKVDMSSVKFIFCGSAPLALETWKRFKELFGVEITEGWGLTEAGANNSVNPVDGLKKVGSIGIPMKGTQMRIVDDNDKELPQGQHGEIVIRGPMLMKGYWNKPKETAEMIKNGWLHTGDVGYVDKDGYFWITDRKKDLIIKGGENISPRTIEEVLFAHPKVSEAAVIGMQDAVYGEEIKAFLVLNPGETATAEEIREYCRKNLTSFFVPKEIVFMQALPKSLVGKVLKKELRNL
jgi:long-chain acyl-CoA synthetase